MFYLGMLLFVWLLGALAIDWSRIRELLPAVLTGAILSGVPTALPVFTLPLRFVGSYSLTDPWAVQYVLQVGVAPVFSAWFAQGLRPGQHGPVRRVALFSLMYSGLELMNLGANMVRYSGWWVPVTAVTWHIVTLTLIARVHAFSRAGVPPHQRGDRSVREVTLPSVLSSAGAADFAAGRADHRPEATS